MITKSSRAMFYAHVFARRGMSKSYSLRYGWMMVSLRTALQNGILRFRFVKANGDIRDAKGTLHPLLIPDDKAPKGTETGKPDFSTIAFFDLDKQEWRSFRITDFEFVLQAFVIKEVML
ncbi:MAG: DUF2693 domain-containing protein [Paludibacteraceae bacterium]|nr:DUF2693 domain-containing protein [Paludibacteraceae bacterium]